MVEPTPQLAPLDSLESLLSELPSAVERSDVGGALDLALDAIDRQKLSLEQLKQLEEAAPLVRGGLEFVDLSLWRSALRDLSELGVLMSKASTVEELNTIRHKVSAVGTTVQTLRSSALRAWSGRVARDLQPTTRLGDALKGIPETRALGLRIDLLKVKVGTLEHNLPIKKVVDDYQYCLKEADEIRTELSGIGGEEIVLFLRSVAEDSATVEGLTEQVLTWIHAKGLDRRFKVKLI